VLWRVHWTRSNFWFPSSDLGADFSASLHDQKTLRTWKIPGPTQTPWSGAYNKLKIPHANHCFHDYSITGVKRIPLWMPQSTYVGRSQKGQTHHTWRYHKPANYNWLMETQLIRVLLEKQKAAQLTKKFAKFYRIQRLITVHLSYVA